MCVMCSVLCFYATRQIACSSTGWLSIQGLVIAFPFLFAPGFPVSSHLVDGLLAPKALDLFFKEMNPFLKNKNMHVNLLVFPFVRQL